MGLAFHRLLLRLGASPFIASVAALLFLVKPIHTEDVCWTYSDGYLLSALLALATLLLLHARRPSWALAPFCAALLVQEMSILLLPTVVLFNRWVMGEQRGAG